VRLRDLVRRWTARQSVGELVGAPQTTTQCAEQGGGDLRVLHDDDRHHGGVEFERLGVLERGHRCRSRTAVEKPHLADHVPGAELGQNERCIARLVALHADAPARDHVQRVADA
jgi:hypothetical protein